MKDLIKYFIKYPIAGNMILLLIAIFGIFGLMNMRTTFFPENDLRNIVVSTVLPGASPEEIEEGIVAKIEDELKGLSGVKRVTSTSSENTGQVLVEIERGFDMDLLLQDVKNAVDRINSFPGNMEPPIVSKLESLTLALNFALAGDVDIKTLKQFAREVEKDLLSVDGISKIKLNGFPEEELVINVRENDLRKYNLTFNQILRAVQGANLDLSGGTIKGGDEEVLIRSREKKYYASDIQDIVVAAAPDGRKLLLREVADINDTWAETPSQAYVNGKRAIILEVNNTTSESLLFIADHIKNYIEEFNEKNDQVKAIIIVDGSVTLRDRIDLLTSNGLFGFALVLILLAMFLQVRIAFWVAISIPISMLGMFIFGPLLDISINAISLFGMILVVGILVDDGIVISENIYQQWENGKQPLQAALDGSIEVLPSVFSSVFTTIIAFSGFLFLPGVTGDFFSDISLVVMLTLSISLLESTFFLPGHIGHSKALKWNTDTQSKIAVFFRPVQEKLWQLMDWMRNRLYKPMLEFFMQYTWAGISIFVGLLIISFSLVSGGLVKITFFPEIESDFISASLKMPSGTPEKETMRLLDKIEEGVWKVNENLKKEQPDGEDLIVIVSKTLGISSAGPASAGAASSPDGELRINLLTAEKRKFTSRQIADSIRKAVGPMYEAEEVTYGVSTPFGKAFSVAVIGDNLTELEAAAEMLKAEMSTNTDIRDVTDSNREGLREINVTLKEKAHLLGLTLQDVIGQVRQGFFGAEIQRLQRGQDEVKVWVRYDLADRGSVGDLENMRIRTTSGATYPLNELADLTVSRGVIAIRRIDGSREIRVDADPAAVDVSTQDVTQQILTEMIPKVQAEYPSVRFSMEGQYRENAKTGEGAAKVYPILFIIMIASILLTFRSVNQTIAVLLTLPFGIIGVIGGHFLFDKPFSIIFSGLGLLALVGIMVNDALVMVSTHNTLIEEGKPFKEALKEAALSRFRPIFLTSITTIAGLGPLILEKSFQAQFLIPMAISIAFGLAASTVVVLLVLPSILILFNQYKVNMIWLWEGTKPEETSVEPALEGRKYYLGLWLLIPAALVALFSGLRYFFS
ncbi:MAG: efflux RND transporter permease subunit [Bacteroidia bacterium]|nr:efflux RND transporter permease subunit [Bacteroidia bacterium]